MPLNKRVLRKYLDVLRRQEAERVTAENFARFKAQAEAKGIDIWVKGPWPESDVTDRLVEGDPDPIPSRVSATNAAVAAEDVQVEPPAASTASPADTASRVESDDDLWQLPAIASLHAQVMEELHRRKEKQTSVDPFAPRKQAHKAVGPLLPVAKAFNIRSGGRRGKSDVPHVAGPNRRKSR